MPVTAEQLRANGCPSHLAEELAGRANGALGHASHAERWRALTNQVLTPELPFAMHRWLFEQAFHDWDVRQGPAPAWFPTDEDIRTSNISRLLERLQLRSLGELHAFSVERPGEFWSVMLGPLGVRLKRPMETILDVQSGVESPRWLCGAELNIVDSCFGASPESLALIAKRESGEWLRWTYADLQTQVLRVTAALASAGFRPGDAIAIDMPMTAESVVIYLGIVAAGCVVVSIADSFAAQEIATRLSIAAAKGVFTQDVVLRAGKRLPLYEKIVAASAPRAVVLPAEAKLACELRAIDISWDDFLNGSGRAGGWRVAGGGWRVAGVESSSPQCRLDEQSVPCKPDDLTNILFSSGTTGEPKAIPWTQTTPIKAATDGFIHQNLQAGDIVAWPTNLGWMMGPWVIYASLMNRATIALYEGAPTGRDFCEFVQDARVTLLGVVPSMVKTWRANGYVDNLDWSAIKLFSSTGECSNPDDMLYLMSRANYRPVIEYCGGTEIGGGYITGSVVQPCVPSAFSTPACGLDLVILDDNAEPADTGEMFLVGPSIGLSTRLLNRDHHQAYYQDAPRGPRGQVLRRHGDQMEKLPGGYYRAQGRVDDTMNLGGIKTSCAEIERVLNSLAGITETAAIAVPPPGGGPSLLVVFAVLDVGPQPLDSLLHRMQQMLKAELNPLFKIHDVVTVPALPRTASNKVMRRELRGQYVASSR